MSEDKTPVIRPIKLKEFDTKQSKYKMVPHLPFRSVILGPSGSGKTILLQNMILDIHRNCCSRIYIFSPSINVDMTWEPVKHYIEKEMKVQRTKEEPIYLDHYDPKACSESLTRSTRSSNTRRSRSIRNSSASSSLRLCRRPEIQPTQQDFPCVISAWDTQLHQHDNGNPKVRRDAPIIRVNARELYVYRLRNYKDLETFVEEVSAVTDKATILQIYNMATQEPYSFLYVNLRATSKHHVFHIRCEKRIEIED